MSLHCDCPLGVHRQGCLLASTADAAFVTTTAPEPEAPASSAWECPRCGVMNAPHVDRCYCRAEFNSWEFRGFDFDFDRALANATITFEDGTGQTATLKIGEPE